MLTTFLIVAIIIVVSFLAVFLLRKYVTRKPIAIEVNGQLYYLSHLHAFHGQGVEVAKIEYRQYPSRVTITMAGGKKSFEIKNCDVGCVWHSFLW